jgi:hypothetical protein
MFTIIFVIADEFSAGQQTAFLALYGTLLAEYTLF